MLCYHVRRNQKGWVWVLPRIRFQIMNTVNASTGYTGFQLQLRHFPRIVLPIVPSTLPADLVDAGWTATSVINTLANDVTDTRDNLLLSKISQTHYASTARNPEPHFNIGEMVMLSITNHRHEYKKKGEKHVAKFLPQWDGPYKITDTHPEASTYTLRLNTNTYPVFHVLQLKWHVYNNPILFLKWVLS